MVMQLNEVVMVSACRTPIGSYGGSLQPVPANELTKLVAAEAIKRAGIDPKQVDEIVAGMCLGHGNGSCPPVLWLWRLVWILNQVPQWSTRTVHLQ